MASSTSIQTSFPTHLHTQLSFNIVHNNFPLQQPQPQPQPRQEQQLIMPIVNSPHTILTFLIAVLLSLMELKCQGKPDVSPFETHPITMRFAIACLLTYSLVYGIQLSLSRFSSSSSSAHRFTMLFGSFSVASLASTLFPDSVQPALYGFCCLLSLGDILNARIKTMWKWIYSTTTNSSLDQGHTLPL